MTIEEARKEYDRLAHQEYNEAEFKEAFEDLLERIQRNSKLTEKLQRKETR